MWLRKEICEHRCKDDENILCKFKEENSSCRHGCRLLIQWEVEVDAVINSTGW